MERLYQKALLALAVSGACLQANAQETVSKITPLVITTGLNEDVIAEKKATATSDYTTSGSGNNTTYTSNYATFVDADNANGGRNAFFATGVQSDGAIKVKAAGDNSDYYYLDGNTDNVNYVMQNVNTTGKNALKLVKSGGGRSHS